MILWGDPMSGDWPRRFGAMGQTRCLAYARVGRSMPARNVASDAEDSKMASFTLPAKLSLPADTHLIREARKYKNFEPMLSQDWTGYYMARVLRD